MIVYQTVFQVYTTNNKEYIMDCQLLIYVDTCIYTHVSNLPNTANKAANQPLK